MRFALRGSPRRSSAEAHPRSAERRAADNCPTFTFELFDRSNSADSVSRRAPCGLLSTAKGQLSLHLFKVSAWSETGLARPGTRRG